MYPLNAQNSKLLYVNNTLYYYNYFLYNYNKLHTNFRVLFIHFVLNRKFYKVLKFVFVL